jgi:hypothetical protein
MPARPPASAPAAIQLDIFADSADVALRNVVVEALSGADLAAARAARERLAAAFGDDPFLPAFDALLGHLLVAGPTPLPHHDALAAARADLMALQVHADHALGAAGPGWMRAQWAALARRSAALPFICTRCEDHAASIWIQAQDWAACATAVESVPSWRRIPAPLGWMLQARLRQGQEDASWPLLAELAWLAPRRLAQVLAAAGNPLTARLLKAFDAHWEGQGVGEAQGGEAGDELAWFPAWLLCETPALAPSLAQAQPGLASAPERGLRVMVELLGLERQGRQADVAQHRRELRGLSPALWQAYIARR